MHERKTPSRLSNDWVFGTEVKRGAELRALRDKVKALYEKGMGSREIAMNVNAEGFRTMKRKCFTAAQVSMIVYQMKRQKALG